MLTKSISLALIAFILMGCTRADSSSMLGQSKLIELMQSTKDLQNSNPSRSLECFQYYSQIFDDHLKVYQTEYSECKNTSAAQTAYLKSKYLIIVDDLNNSSQSACQALTICSNSGDSLDALACYDDAGGNNTRVMYSISTTASLYHSQLEFDIKSVAYVEQTCASTAQHKYDKNVSQAYVDLQNCLSGLAPVLSETKTTTPAEISQSTNGRTSTNTTPLTLSTDDESAKTTKKNKSHGLMSDINNLIHNVEHIV